MSPTSVGIGAGGTLRLTGAEAVLAATAGGQPFLQAYMYADALETGFCE